MYGYISKFLNGYVILLSNFNLEGLQSKAKT